jgi:hypothetical protein
MNNLITAIMLFTLGLAPFSWVLFQDSGILTNELNIWILFFPFLLLFSINYPYEIEFTKYQVPVFIICSIFFIFSNIFYNQDFGYDFIKGAGIIWAVKISDGYFDLPDIFFYNYYFEYILHSNFLLYTGPENSTH